MKRLLPALAATTSLCLAGTTDAATLVSSALDNNQTNLDGSSGIFGGNDSGGVAPAVGGVTTTVVSNPGDGDNINGTQTVKLRAVSAANGMDLTYDVNFTPFRYDASANTDVEEQSRINDFVAVKSFNNADRESTTTLLQGDGSTDIEFFRVTIDNVVNTGSTTFFLDGAITLRFNGLVGISIQESYANGVSGTVLASGGVNPALFQDDDLALSSPSTSFAIVATDDDTTGSRANFDNRWEGIAVQFNDVPEPGSLALLGLGGLCVLRRRR